MLNLAVLLEDSARRFPQRAAVVTGADSLTFSRLDATASRVAGLLRAVGVRPGDAVALTCPNRTRIVELCDQLPMSSTGKIPQA